MDPPCCLLELPSELRISIYELVLSFPRPLKLRQTVAGSENTSLLRANKQIYREALSVLYDVNTITVTRNDFCKRTHESLKTPVPSERIQHLLVTSFGESIACNFLLDRCDVCEPSALGFLEALKSMPQLKSVVVDYHTHTSNFRSFRESVNRTGSGCSLACTGVGQFTMQAPAFTSIEFTFQNVPLARIWQALIALSSSPRCGRDEEEALAELRKIDADMPDKLWLLVWARRHPVMEQWPLDTHRQFTDLRLPMDLMYELWTITEVNLNKSAMLEAFTQCLQNILGRQTAPQCRRFLSALREYDAELGLVNS
ncbi:hypothetical protein LTR36_008520 [Oleoguttula mirabilis]|uniref:F-box domain-containing protein n=1 Tax=Oleoguttula mirabilis TaxID=1507867 RepID=A0AAV9JUG6_9PEZI|nr:hypothetical protein LTR36_008520 [Oleoguttula mirabilis]